SRCSAASRTAWPGTWRRSKEANEETAMVRPEFQRAPQPGALDPIERASRDELQSLQLERLRWSLRHAYDNVAHYRQSFIEAGVHPDDLKSLADLAKFPFTDKKTLRDHY